MTHSVFIHTPESFVLQPGEARYIRLDASLRQPPTGSYRWLVVPSDGLLEHHVSVVGGDEGILVINHGQLPRHFHEGEVLCMLHLVKVASKPGRRRKNK